METKRCQRCHKLLRVDAQTCSRCGGYDFLPVSQSPSRYPDAQPASETSSAPPRAARTSSPVGSPLSPLPPTQLSPHRAGHYSGLHPEDEPYQSSFLPVQRPPLSAQPALEVEEVEDLAFSTVPDMPDVPAPMATPKRRVASLTPLPSPRQQRSTQTLRAPLPEQSETERNMEVVRTQVPVIISEPRPLALAPRPPRSKQRSMAVRLLLIISCFLFVVASGIMTFLLLVSRPVPELQPVLTAEAVGKPRANSTLLLSGSRFEASAEVTITRDENIPVLDDHGHPLETRTYSTGNFSVSITIGVDWVVGWHVIHATDEQNHKASAPIKVEETPTTPPLLQLAPNHVDLGEDSAGVISHKSITLMNSGGGQVDWQSSSDAPTWLKLTPTYGSFAGGGREVVITVDRGTLTPQSYKGHIRFTQQGSNNPAQILTVTMGVNPAAANPASANLVLSNAAFTFTGNPVTNPVAQTLTIQNTGGQGLNWTASAATTSGGNWLTLSSSAGYLGAGAVASMTVNATSAGLSPGIYAGTLTFSYAGASATPVTVTLTVNAPPVARITLSPGELNFHSIMGRNPSAQSFTITDTGNAPLNWGISEDSNGKTYAPVSQASGTLAPAKSVAITVTPSVAQAGAGTLNALITVIDTDAGTPVVGQQINLTFTIVNQAVISLDQNQLIYNHTGAIPNSAQLITLTNTGSAPLNWSLTITNSSLTQWLSVDVSSGTGLNPGGAVFINVTCDSTNVSPGTYSATLTLSDSDAGTPVAPQVVTVTVNVS